MLHQMINSIQHPFSAIVIGPPKSGKTHLIRYLIQEMVMRKDRSFDYIIVFSRTAGVNNSFGYLPYRYVHSTYQPEMLQAVIDTQESRIGQGQPSQCLLILDDVVGMVSWQNQVIDQLWSTYRHWDMSIIISTQYVYKIPPLIRESVDRAFIF